jgi:hypothetical protein
MNRMPEQIRMRQSSAEFCGDALAETRQTRCFIG